MSAVACLLRAQAVGVPRGVRMPRRLTVAMNPLWIGGLLLALTVSRAFATAIVPPPSAPPHTADPGTVTVDTFNNTTQAIVHFDDGANSGTVNTLVTQFAVTYLNSDGSPVTFETFCIDLFHTVSPDQVYPVTLRDSLDPFYANGDRMRYILEHFGASDLSSNPDQAAAVQIALWDLSLNNHDPTFFGPDVGGTYSSGDPNVFRVDLGSNPDAAAIAALVNQYLVASEGAATSGSWLDASAAGDSPQRGQSLLLPPPWVIGPNGVDLVAAPPSPVLLVAGLLVLCLHRRRARGRRINPVHPTAHILNLEP